jgi:hypothetical protein
MSKRKVLPLYLVLFLIISGCFTYTANLNKSPYVDQSALTDFMKNRPAKSPEQIKFIKNIPDKPFVVLGTLHAPQVEWTAHYDMDDLIGAMRTKAAAIGADAILDFRTKENPTVVMSGSISPYYGGAVSAIPYKGLHAWGEAIIFVSKDEKETIEPSK